MSKELKLNFAQGKMNKDLDERLMSSTGQGQYRDALNIQVSTSDGDDVGTAQTIMGNTQLTNVFDFTSLTIPTTATVVGSIAKPQDDKIYYLVSSGDINTSNAQPDLCKDYVIEFDTVTQTFKYVFVDIFRVKTTISVDSNSTFINVPTSSGSAATMNKTGIRRGMFVTGTLTNNTGGAINHPTQGYSIANGTTYYLDESDSITVTDIIYDSSNTRWKIYTSSNIAVKTSDSVIFTAPRVLELGKRRPITAINILDDTLFYTDGANEPKKINITRSILGTGGTTFIMGGGVAGNAAVTTSISDGVFSGDNDYFHTRLVKETMSTGVLKVVTNAAKQIPVDASKDYVTVIKKNPTQPLLLKMYRTLQPRIDDDGNENTIFTTHHNGATSLFNDGTDHLVESGTVISNFFFDTPVDYRDGDIIFFIPGHEDDGGLTDNFDQQYAYVRAEIISSPVANANSLSASGFEIQILSINPKTSLESGFVFNVRRKSGDPLFEFNFPRFSYRYKYQDGEYSCFAPWSEVAFLTDPYEYFPKKGFNLGMRNQLRSLSLCYYFYPEKIAPQDIVEIDLLYKETNNPTVYTIKTLKPTDGGDIWPDLNSFPEKRGEYELKTDLVHAVVPSNQLLRPYDNVPRTALAQEISANRLIYANYLQNYTVQKDPILKINVHSRDKKQIVGDNSYLQASTDNTFGFPSVKSIRKYQIGVVFSDYYGRETPILTSKECQISLDQSYAANRNRLISRLWNGTQIPNWAKYFSFYIKETSSEYYSLAMDRWYNAADGNIWLSFPSSERNKLDEETFLILKKAHGSDTPVLTKARYKILAIENEAPDFIKTVKKPLGDFLNSNADKIGNNTRGFPVQDSTYILVDDESFEAIYGDDMHMKNFDKITIRFIGNGQMSNEYEITKISRLTEDYKLKIKGQIQPDAAFVSTGDSYATCIPDLSFELVEYDIEEKPEFDGRFFVKIYKDATLEENVLNTAGESIDYSIAETWQLRYINNHAYTKADSNTGGKSYLTGDAWTPQTSTGTGVPGSGVNFSRCGPIRMNAVESHQDSDTTLGQHPTQYNHHPMYRWANGSSDTDDTNSIPSVDGLTCDDARYGTPYFLGDDTWNPHPGGGGVNPNAREYWTFIDGTKDFFIDAATAYSWTSKEKDWNKKNIGGDEFKDRPGNDYGGRYDNANMYKNGEVASSVVYWFGWRYGSDASMSGHVSNTKYRKGQPSRGIWFGPNGECYMDISWSGMGRGDNPMTNWSDVKNGDSPERLDEASSKYGSPYSEALNFIEKLCTPGTKFRFQKDPDEIIYTVEEFDHPDCGWGASDIWTGQGANFTRGVWGIRNYKDCNQTCSVNSQLNRNHTDNNKRQRWTIKISPRIGDPGNAPSEYNPVTGTINGAPNSVQALRHDGSDFDVIEILKQSVDYGDGGAANYTDNPAIWETEPKENVELDIYYQASPLIPIELNEYTNEELLHIGTHFFSQHSTTGEFVKHEITKWTGPQTIEFTPALPTSHSIGNGADIYFYKKNYYNVGVACNGAVSAGATSLTLHGEDRDSSTFALWKKYHVLDWNNCWTFFNGAESDRARDDFNQKQMDNGVKASTVLAGPVKEEHRKHGFIWSGIYNSNSGVNDTNQFIMAEAITKDLNPEYGSIQKLHQRNTDLITLCEDKVLKVLSNKDALFNADGNSNVTATAKVLGAAQPYKGNYGISTNPESFVATPYQLYFGDASRGQICALSGEGIRTISTLGMTDYFNDILKEHVWQLLGTYDEKKKEYNISIKKKISKHQIVPTITTLSYNERSKGWVSFKSFQPQDGISLNNEYYTFFNGGMWKHHTNETRNNFYGTQYNSDVTLIFSQPSSTVKKFETINYEGSKQKITAFTSSSHTKTWTGNASSGNGISTVSFTDAEYFNLTAQNGWYVDSVVTDLQKSTGIEFKDKEGKYYGYIKGVDTVINPLDKLGDTWHEQEFSTQGIGTGGISHDDPDYGGKGVWTFKNNVSSTYVGADGSGDAWDTQALGNE